MTIYCSVGAHCQAGMVMMVNPASQNDLNLYAQKAKVVQMAEVPKQPPSGGSFRQGISGGLVQVSFVSGECILEIGYLQSGNADMHSSQFNQV